MEESSYIHKSDNVTVLIYHLVTPAKYRRVIFKEELDDYLCKICEDIEARYEIRFLEIGVDKDHVHFLLQSIPMYSPTKITQIIKSITSKEMFKKYPNLKEKLWGSEFWSKGYFMSTVCKHGDERKLRNYVKNQGSDKPSYKAFQQKQSKLTLCLVLNIVKMENEAVVAYSHLKALTLFGRPFYLFYLQFF